MDFKPEKTLFEENELRLVHWGFASADLVDIHYGGRMQRIDLGNFQNPELNVGPLTLFGMDNYHHLDLTFKSNGVNVSVDFEVYSSKADDEKGPRLHFELIWEPHGSQPQFWLQHLDDESSPIGERISVP